MSSRSCAVLVIGAILTSGCSTLTSPGRSQSLEENRPYWFDYAGDRRGAVLVPTKSGSVFMCSEPVPRVFSTVGTEGKGNLTVPATVGVPTGTITAGGEGKVTTAVTALNEEVMVLFLREALYRLCEMSVNIGSLDKDSRADVLRLYNGVIDAAVNLSGRNETQIRAKTTERYLEVLSQGLKTSVDTQAVIKRQSDELQRHLDLIRKEIAQSMQTLADQVNAVRVSQPQEPSVPSVAPLAPASSAK